MKQTLLLFAALLSLAVARAQDVKVTQMVPLHCKTGEKCTVEIEIEKKGVEGFARIQQPLPEGFTATLLQDGGADFSFDKQKVSFIWLNLPATPVIRVSYQISVRADISGAFTLTDGVFSFIQDTKIQKTPIPPATMEVNMKPGTPVAAQQEARPLEPVVAAQKPADQDPSKVAVDRNAPAEPAPQKPAEKAVKAPEPKAEPVVVQPVPEPEPMKEPAVAEPLPEPKPKAEPAVVQPKPEPKAEPVTVQPAPEPKPKAEPVMVKTEPQPKVNTEPAAPAPKTSTSPGGTPVYRVQFSALKTYKDPAVVQKQMGITEEVFYISVDGWYKYSFGKWNRREDAEAACREFNQKTGKKTFVVVQ
ncbi:MAG TPA: hypothetical protein P5228_07285 [Bacteroidales bacterium]|nr:hypothetical protein [Bacteroidales bacterium]